MGCGASTTAHMGQIDVQGRGRDYLVQVNHQWNKAMGTLEVKKGHKYPAQKLVVKRSGWKTVRIFVSSTFKDFHPEREVLVKKVFPDLRVWCEQHRLQLIECDLRWGVPQDFTTEGTLRACLGEIDRCYQDNIQPFFLNMTSERVGWIPQENEVPQALRDQYTWVEGLSVTEMEIMHGAYRHDNPNALFLLRNASFLDSVPKSMQTNFIDGNPIAPCKLEILKKMIKDRFPDDRLAYYDVQFNGVNPDGTFDLGGLDGTFSKTVYDFFKRRISVQYPLHKGQLDPYMQVLEQHESFMKNRCESVLGRDAILNEVRDYVTGMGTDVPLLLLGDAGCGKSSVMAKVAEVASQMAALGQIPSGGQQGWHVFYHFVGAVPGSTELEQLLRRLLREMGVCNDSKMPTNLDIATQMACGALNNPHSRPTLIIVDALNQLDEDMAATLVSWVPRKLAPHIRCVFSMIPGTPQHKAFMGREPSPVIIQVGPLDATAKRAIVEDMLGKYNKRLDQEQMRILIGKKASDNPLWLSIACEELRVFGQFRQITNKINKFPDGLLELEQEVLTRFEKENGGELLVGALCLLEVSSRGLLEVELLEILADEDNLMPRNNNKDRGAEKDDSCPEKNKKDLGYLPAYKWSEVYRALKPFIRPFGDSGEGRLDFYHRSLSKAVRKKYFQDSKGDDRKDVYEWWHRKLIDYFEHCANFNRKLEEYPIHLIAVKDERLVALLTDWEVFDALYNEIFSTRLVYLWREGSDFQTMEDSYNIKMNNYVNSDNVDKEILLLRYTRVSQFMAQAGRHTFAGTLLDKAMTLEQEDLGNRPEKMKGLYHLKAIIQDEVMKMEEFMYRSQLPRYRDIIANFEKSAELRKDDTAEEDLFTLGRIKNRLAFYYSGYSLRGGDSQLSASDAKEKAMTRVEEALEIFRKLGDELNVADALTTKGVVYGSACPEQIKNYKEASEMIERLAGDLNVAMDRLLLNMAIYYEESGDYTKAFELFTRWFHICRDLYGLQHPKTRRPINTLREPMYKRFAQEQGLPVPDLPEQS